MYDVIVVGGGPGGYKSAEILGKSGKKVALIEKDEIGGVCLNCGCIPFKHYLHNVQTIDKIELDRICREKNEVISGLRKGVELSLKGCGVDVIRGRARIEKSVDGIIRVRVNDDLLESNKLIIATGSSEKKLEALSGSRDDFVINSEKMLELTEIPKEIDIVGGGAIGLEAAAIFSKMGSSVTVIEALDLIGGNIDSEIATVARSIFERHGISILTNTRLISVADREVVYQSEAGQIIRRPEYVLTSMGRKPSIDNEMLDALEVDYDDTGIIIDDSCMTSNSNVYACGDITGKLMLAHTAYKQARTICDSISGKETAIDYALIPQIIYSIPQILSVGLTEDDCRNGNVIHQVRTIPMTYNGKYYAEYGKDGSKAKMIIDSEERVIGIHIVANDIVELAFAAEQIVMNKTSVRDILNVPIAHPTYGEIIGELAESFVYGRG